MSKGNTYSTGGFYLLAFIGAAVYFIGQSSDFWGGVVGFLKALVWPAFLIYEIFATLSV
jgi:TM2 domain-containing membrane protein YozV